MPVMPTGDALIILRANFNRHVVRDINGCLRWIASKNDKGYGRFAVRRKLYNAQVIAWLLAGKPLELTDDVDHLCEVKDCVEITHLEAVTHAENIKRHYRRHPKPLCSKGLHPDTEENTYRTKLGYRSCRACVLARGRARA